MAIYARVSTPGREKENGKSPPKQHLEIQVDSLIDYCKRQGWEWEVFTDSLSGKDTKRPKFQDMRSRLFKKEFDIVLASKLDRISRSVLDFCSFATEIDLWGIRLIILDQGIDTDIRNPMSRLLMNVLAAFAAFEREMIVDRVKRGIANAKSKGLHIGGKYNEALSEVWELVQRWRKQGMGYGAIASKLELDRGIKIHRQTIKKRLDKEKQLNG